MNELIFKIASREVDIDNMLDSDLIKLYSSLSRVDKIKCFDHLAKAYNTGRRFRLDIDNEKIKELYEDGVSVAEISRVLGVSYGTVLNRLHEIGIYKPRNRRGFNPHNL